MTQLANMGYLRRFLYRLNYEQRTGIKRHHTLRRLFNFLLIRLQMAVRFSYVLGYPYFLVIESTNLCNLSCPLCPTGQKIEGRRKGKISFKDFKSIIDNLGPYLYSIRLENWGEPLLNESLFDMLGYANKKRINTSFNTNLSILNEESARRLVLSGLNHVKISLDGTTQETYTKYRVGGNFNKVIDNIKLLIQMRRSLNKPHPFIELQFIVMQHNEHQIQEMQQLSLDLGVDNLLIESVRPDMRGEFLKPNAYSIDKYKDWLPKDSKYSLFDYETKSRKKKANTCTWLWTSSIINWDGSIVPCCGAYDMRYDFGNFFKDGFQKVWNGQKYIAARSLIGRKEDSGIETICTNCFKYGIVS